MDVSGTPQGVVDAFAAAGVELPADPDCLLQNIPPTQFIQGVFEGLAAYDITNDYYGAELGGQIDLLCKGQIIETANPSDVLNPEYEPLGNRERLSVRGLCFDNQAATAAINTEYAPECLDDFHCARCNVCFREGCEQGVCTQTPNRYGDVDGNGTVSIFDLFCMLSGFGGDFSVCSFQDCDISPCEGDGTIGIFDLFGVLNAFGGADPCCYCIDPGDPGTWPSMPPYCPYGYPPACGPGACCDEIGDCTITLDWACTGVFLGTGTDCGPPNPCVGACCHGDGTCTETTQAACNGANDTYQGDGTLCANFKPTITTHPQNLTVCKNKDATFTIAATGTGTLHYQWKKNGANVGDDNNTLTLNNVPLADNGAAITCEVKDDCATTTSNPATLTVQASTDNAAFVAANATVTEVAPNAEAIGLLGTSWGLAWPQTVDVAIAASCDSGQWCAVVTGLDGEYSIQARLLPGVTEVTGPPPGNSTMANFCAQVTQLNALGGVAWYMLAAVQAHEAVHATRFGPAMVAAAPTIEADIETLCVAFTASKTEAQAITEIKALPAWATKVAGALNTWRAQILVLVGGDHAAGGPTDTAEHAVVDPMIGTICTHANDNCWGPCNPPCPANTKGACCTGANCACTTAGNCVGPSVYKGNGTKCNPNPCP